MAKNFPYFKFIASEWLTGNISLENFDVQGVFINVCSLYWVKDGIISLEDLNKRYKNSELILYLIANGYIFVENGFVSIDFLNEQLKEANHISYINSEKGKKSAAAKALRIKESSTVVEPNLTEVQPNLTNKRKENKIKEKENKEIVLFEKEQKFDFRRELILYGFNEQLVNEWLLVRKNKKSTNTETAFKKFIIEIEKIGGNINETIETCIEKSWAGLKKEWIDNLKNNNNGKSNIGTKAGQEHPLQHIKNLSEAILDDFARKNSEGGNI